MSERNDPTKTTAVLTPGTKIGHYHIVKRAGAGGMGEVYLAEDKSLNRKVALKFLSALFDDNSELRERFAREAQAMARIVHPNIVTIHEVGQYLERPFFVMEYVEGMTLHHYCHESPLPIDDVIEIAAQICDALAKAHAGGIIHRDIKPGNIILDSDHRPRILDFGLATLKDSDNLTQTGSTLGTVAYMSPEQVEGEKVDHRTDLFSLGVLIYELIACRSPFKRDNQAATLRAITDANPEPPQREGTVLPTGLEQIILKLLEHDRESRYQSAAEVADHLRALTNDSSSAGLAETQVKSIAVLPLVNLSSDPEQDYFCDGIAEDIINDLTGVVGLRVVARTSAFAFKGLNDDIRSIGRKLNVETILEGSVQRGGKRVRVTAQLIDVRTGYHLWSERYDRELDDIFEIQDDITSRIVEKLKVQFGTDAADERAHRRSDNIDAYQLYLKGRYAINRRTIESLHEARDRFNEALELDAEYVPALVGVAEANFLLYAYETERTDEFAALSRIQARKALKVNPDSGEAFATLGGLATYYDWNWATANDFFDQALTLSPQYSVAHQWYAELLTFQSRDEEAMKHFERALELDPLSQIVMTMFGFFLHKIGQLDRAASLLEKAIELGTQNDTTFVALAFVYHDQGRTDEAMQQLELARKYSHDSVYSLTMYGHCAALSRNLDSTREMLRLIYENNQSESLPPSYLGILYFDLQEEETAMSFFETALRTRDYEMIWIRCMSYYRNLRRSKRLSSLLCITGLPQGD